MKKIRITCKGADELPLESFENFQGGLKSLSEVSFKKLKREILERGFSFPVHVWKDRKKNKILDGHQRIRTLIIMASEGYKIPPIPVVYVDAKDEAEAKLKVLSGASQYGKVDRQGLYEFIEMGELELDEVTQVIELPSVDTNIFLAEYYQEPAAQGDLQPGSIQAEDTSLPEPPAPNTPDQEVAEDTDQKPEESSSNVIKLPTVEDPPEKPKEPRDPQPQNDKTKITYEFLPEEKQEVMAFSDDLMKKWKLTSHAEVIHHAIIEAHKKNCRKK